MRTIVAAAVLALVCLIATATSSVSAAARPNFVVKKPLVRHTKKEVEPIGMPKHVLRELCQKGIIRGCPTEPLSDAQWMTMVGIGRRPRLSMSDDEVSTTGTTTTSRRRKRSGRNGSWTRIPSRKMDNWPKAVATSTRRSSPQSLSDLAFCSGPYCYVNGNVYY